MFKFRLAKFLNVKEQEEKNRLRELNFIRNKRLALLNEADEIQTKINQSRSALHAKIVSNRGAGYLSGMQGAFEQNMLAGIAQKKNEAMKMEQLEAASQKKYELAYKSRKVLENLKERQYVHFLEEKKRKLNRFYDEILVNNYSVNQSKNEG